MQQAVNTNAVRLEVLDNKASIARATNFNISNEYDTGSESISWLRKPELEAAVNVGLYGNVGDRSQVTGSCPSANCTWEPYTSLAFCSTAEDVTGTVSTTTFTELRDVDMISTRLNITSTALEGACENLSGLVSNYPNDAKRLLSNTV